MDSELIPCCPSVSFTKVSRFTLVMNAGAVHFGVSILDCIDVAHLELFEVESTFTRTLYHACKRIIANTKIDVIRINFVPIHPQQEIVVAADFLKSVEENAKGKEICIGIPFQQKSSGIRRVPE